MHTVIDFRTQDEHEQREHGAIEFTVDEETAALIRVSTRTWRQRNGLEPTDERVSQ
jgi:hypothetical protein